MRNQTRSLSATIVFPYALLSAAAMTLICGTSTVFAEKTRPQEIPPERELLITAPAVVDSDAAQYPGAWSFGTLVEQLVGPEKASGAVRDWLETWLVPKEFKSQVVGPRRDIFEKVIRPWRQRDGYSPASGLQWEPNLAHAPFRLLAIVNRMDLCAPRVAGVVGELQKLARLAGHEKEFASLIGLPAPSARPVPMGGGYGGGIGVPEAPSTSGEGRLIFGAIDDTGKPLDGAWTVIFEYDLLGKSDRDWANSWHSLGQLELSDPAFNSTVESLTKTFTHGKQQAQSPVHLAQLRSSEAAFGPDREFRQFELTNGKFSPVELTHTPAPSFALKNSPEQRALNVFLHEQDPLIRRGVNLLPENISDHNRSFVVPGGSAFIPADEPNFHWDLGTQISRDARRIFSLNTCNGCHAGETACAEGLHVHPRAEGEPARLSDFLRADGKPLRIGDPDMPGIRLEYQEMNDRAAIFAALLEPKDRATLEALRPILRNRLARTH